MSVKFAQFVMKYDETSPYPTSSSAPERLDI